MKSKRCETRRNGIATAAHWRKAGPMKDRRKEKSRRACRKWVQW